MYIQDIPLSGIFLCYVPLLVTVVGFVTAAVLTDVNSRRTYLRKRDLRPENEQSHEAIQWDRPVTAQTPHGTFVTVQPEGTTTYASQATTPSVPPAATEIKDDDPEDYVDPGEGKQE